MAAKTFSAFMDFLLSKQCMVSKPARNLLQGAIREYTDEQNDKEREWNRREKPVRLPALRRDFCGFCCVVSYNSNMRYRRGADGRTGECMKKRGDLLIISGVVKEYLKKTMDFKTCRKTEELFA